MKTVLIQSLKRLRKSCCSNNARLRGLKEDIGDQPTPDLALLTKARNEARAALEQSRDAQSRLKNELDGRQQVLGQVQRLTTQINDLEKEYGPVGGLSV